MDAPVRTVDDLIDRLGRAALMDAAGVGRTALCNWRRSGRVPVAKWPALVDLARARGIDGVTYETLRALSAGSAAESTAPRMEHAA